MLERTNHSRVLREVGPTSAKTGRQNEMWNVFECTNSTIRSLDLNLPALTTTIRLLSSGEDGA